LRGYAAPLLSQPEGVARLSLEAPDGYEDHWCYQERFPEHWEALSTLFNLNRQACKIYTTRAMAGPEAPTATALVENFKATLETFPSNSPVEHTTVWPTFVAACESATAEHQQFFTNILLKHHERNGFANTLRALQHLRRIWSRRAEESWTMLLPEPRVFIV